MSSLESIECITSGQMYALQIKFKSDACKTWGTRLCLLAGQSPDTVAEDLRRLADKIEMEAIKR